MGQPQIRNVGEREIGMLLDVVDQLAERVVAGVEQRAVVNDRSARVRIASQSADRCRCREQSKAARAVPRESAARRPPTAASRTALLDAEFDPIAALDPVHAIGSRLPSSTMTRDGCLEASMSNAVARKLANGRILKEDDERHRRDARFAAALAVRFGQLVENECDSRS